MKVFFLVFLMISLLIICACQLPFDSVDSNREEFSCIPCNIKTISDVTKNMEKIKDSQVEKFLCTIKKECELNIEFSQYSNEVLFDILDKHTNKFVIAFSKVPVPEREYLLFVISNPLLDYNIEDFQLKVKNSEGSTEIKSLILKALKDAD